MTTYRVVYGETRPMWEQTFPTMRDAKAFAKKHKSFGDVIFSVKKVVFGEWPQSITAAIEAYTPQAAARATETGLRGALEEIRAHLGAARIQRAPSDDKIIAEHIDAAFELARVALAKGAGS
jgi:hypothetical protein